MFAKMFLVIMCLSRSNQSCEKGCLKCNGQNECLICDANMSYILSPEGKKCEQIEKKNCTKISFEGNCLVCKSGYYLDGGQCVEVTNKVLNCALWASEVTCSLCQTNYALIN